MRPTLKEGVISSMSGLWPIHQLALARLYESSNSIGQIELYYKEFPKNMSSFAGTFFSCKTFSSFLSGILVSVIHKISLKAQIGDWLPEDPNNGRLEYF
jgi:hypothetical protein